MNNELRTTNYQLNTSDERQATCDEFTPFCACFALFCTFCASLRLKRTVFNRLQIKVRSKGRHKLNTEYYILATNRSLPTYQVGQRNLRLINDLRSTKVYVRKNKLFMQNEPNFRKVKLNVNNVLTKDYDRIDTWSIRKNEPKTNPNKAKSKKTKMNVNRVLTKDYENKTPIRAPKKQSQTLKRQKPMQTSLPQRIMKITAFSGSDKTKPNKPKQTQFHHGIVIRFCKNPADLLTGAIRNAERQNMNNKSDFLRPLVLSAAPAVKKFHLLLVFGRQVVFNSRFNVKNELVSHKILKSLEIFGPRKAALKSPTELR